MNLVQKVSAIRNYLLEEADEVYYLGDYKFKMIENEEVTKVVVELFTTDEGIEGFTLYGHRNGHSFPITTLRFNEL